ncbi:MAG: diaminopimelate decarboxylase [Bryobacteraceae bacterium]
MLSETYQYRQGSLYCEGVALADIARAAGSPCYVYSAAAIRDRYRAYDRAFGERPHLVCYAVKANSNLSILELLAAEGAGFDIVSGGELYRVIAAGADPGKVVFSGTGKTREEIDYALETGIHSFNCESWDELVLIDSLAARLAKRPSVAFRVNPDVDAETHRHISTGTKINKFGIDIDQAREIYSRAMGLANVAVEGVSCHIGSQIFKTDRMIEAARHVVALAADLRAAGVPIRHLDLGGGLGVAYEPGVEPPAIADYVRSLCEASAAESEAILKLEPGRSITADAGVLLTQVLYRKDTPSKRFVIVDASMSELIRPVLYEAHHEILPVRQAPERGTIMADVVGPVCESGDFLAQDREVPNAMPRDLLAVCTAGAYGFVQASNYNSRPRPAEVLVDADEWRVIRKRESYADLVRGEELQR